MLIYHKGFLGGSVVKNSPGNAGDMRQQAWSLVRKIPWKRKWQPTPVFLPGESQGREPGGLLSLGSQSQTWLKRLSSSSCSFVLSDFFSMWFVNYQINISFRKYNFITSFLFPVIVAQTWYSNNAIWLSWADYLKQCLSMLFVSLRWLENDNLGDNFNGSLLTYQNLIL